MKLGSIVDVRNTCEFTTGKPQKCGLVRVREAYVIICHSADRQIRDGVVCGVKDCPKCHGDTILCTWFSFLL